jgi:hypothetical protein
LADIPRSLSRVCGCFDYFTDYLSSNCHIVHQRVNFLHGACSSLVSLKFHFACLDMEVNIQPHKRKQCFSINAENGEYDFVQDFSMEEEQRCAISKLELWKRAGQRDSAALIDPNHEKMLLYADKSVKSGTVSRSSSAANFADAEMQGGLVDAKEALQQSVEFAQKAALELNLLVGFTKHLRSNQVFSLQSCFPEQREAARLSQEADRIASTSSASTNSETAKKEEVAPPLKYLPIAQSIDISRQSIAQAKSVLQSGLALAKSNLVQRHAVAHSLQQLTGKEGFSICAVEKRNGKKVLTRKYDPVKDILAVDLSVGVQPTGAVTPAAVAPTGTGTGTGGAASIGDSVAENPSFQHFIPLRFENNSIVVEESSVTTRLSASTLQVELLYCCANSPSQVVVASVNAAQIAGHVQGTHTAQQHQHQMQQQDGSGSGDQAMEIVEEPPPTSAAQGQFPGSSSGSSTSTAANRGALDSVISYCRDQQHAALCQATFARLRHDCITENVAYDVLCLPNLRTNMSPSDVPPIQQALHSEMLIKTISLVELRDTEILLRLSESLFLRWTLVPLVDVEHNDSGVTMNGAPTELSHGGSEGSENMVTLTKKMHTLLTTLLVSAQLATLPQATTKTGTGESVPAGGAPTIPASSTVSGSLPSSLVNGQQEKQISASVETLHRVYHSCQRLPVSVQDIASAHQSRAPFVTEPLGRVSVDGRNIASSGGDSSSSSSRNGGKVLASLLRLLRFRLNIRRVRSVLQELDGTSAASPPVAITAFSVPAADVNSPAAFHEFAKVTLGATARAGVVLLVGADSLCVAVPPNKAATQPVVTVAATAAAAGVGMGRPIRLDCADKLHKYLFSCQIQNNKLNA